MHEHLCERKMGLGKGYKCGHPTGNEYNLTNFDINYTTFRTKGKFIDFYLIIFHLTIIFLC